MNPNGGVIVSTELLEQRVAAVEAEVAGLRRKVELMEAKRKGNWLPKVLGRFKDDPDFAEIARVGRLVRETGRLPDEFADEGAGP